MRYGVCAFACLAVFAPLVNAHTVDKAKIRQSIEMPSISTSLGVHFRSHERDGRGNKFDPNIKLADFQKKLTGGPEDATIYLEQHAVCIECLKDEKKAKEMAAKAEAVLRPHMQTADPRKGHLFALYGSVLETIMENPWSDCEKWARQGVKVAPQDWRAWSYLAHVRAQHIPAALHGGADKLAPGDRRSHEILGALFGRRLRPQHVDEAEKVLVESLQFHDKAKELAPNEPKRQEQRYGFRVSEIMLRNGIAAYRGQKFPYPLEQFERVLLDELQETARLHPEHLLWQSQLVHNLTLLGWDQNKDKDGKPSKTFRPARPEDAQTIRDALSRIETIAGQAKGESAVFCYTMLGALCATMQDHAASEKHARKALEIDPANQLAGEQLQQALSAQERRADQLQAAQTLTKANPTSRNYYLLAKAFALTQRHDLAESACLSGLKQNPADVHCLLGTAALWMRKSDDPATLKLASEILERARRECGPASGPSVPVDIEYLSAIHQALSGEPTIARFKLERLKADHPESPRYDNVLSAIGR